MGEPRGIDAEIGDEDDGEFYADALASMVRPGRLARAACRADRLPNRPAAAPEQFEEPDRYEEFDYEIDLPEKAEPLRLQLHGVRADMGQLIESTGSAPALPRAQASPVLRRLGPKNPVRGIDPRCGPAG